MEIVQEIKKTHHIDKRYVHKPESVQENETHSILWNFDVLVWFGGFYGISTFVGYLTPNPFLCK